jgi:hypothetical protein
MGTEVSQQHEFGAAFGDGDRECKRSQFISRGYFLPRFPGKRARGWYEIAREDEIGQAKNGTGRREPQTIGRHAGWEIRREPHIFALRSQAGKKQRRFQMKNVAGTVALTEGDTLSQIYETLDAVEKYLKNRNGGGSGIPEGSNCKPDFPARIRG